MSLMRAVTKGRMLAISRLPSAAAARTSAFIPSTPDEWEAAGYEVSKKNGAPKIVSPWNKWFPYEPVPYSPKLGPYITHVEKDHVYYWCSCGESAHESQPWCDQVGCKDTKFHPVVFIPTESGKQWFCGSKHTPSRPIFNGTCWTVWMDVNTLPAAGLCFGISFVTGVLTTWMVHP
ncbi:ATG7 [Symbiodinium necroappetens]|uniref:ATG7 protein n=1 Tax=Symbiodinium necroappetens TaxID=1628268 RepID=A0A812WPF4_9DINO|nr:ATG7 [Symbiodinium necroappetens]